MPSSIELDIGPVPSPRRQGRARDAAAGPAPFRILALGDFSGASTGRRGALSERRPVRIDVDAFDAVFARLAPTAEIAGLRDASGAPLRIALAAFEEFGADALLARLPAPAAPSAHGVAAEAEASGRPAPAAAEDAAATLRRLLGGNVPDSAPARAGTVAPGPAQRADAAVDRFIRRLVGETAVTGPLPAPAADADAGVGAARTNAALLRHVLRDPAWRHLECAWRGVDRFVRELDAHEGDVRLELLDCRADELLGDLAATEGEAERSALKEAMRGDGRGCALLVSLEEFGPGVAELSLLGGLAALAAAHGAVLLAGAAPALAAVATSDDPQARASQEGRIWRALRESALGPRIALTFPRLLARLPYGPRHDPVAAFAFDELADAPGAAQHDALLWRSAALDVALLLAQGYAEGGDAGVEACVQLDDLPAFIDRSGDEPRLQAVAEAYLGERDAGLLQAAGLIALQSDRRVPHARVTAWRAIAADGAPLAGCWRRGD